LFEKSRDARVVAVPTVMSLSAFSSSAAAVAVSHHWENASSRKNSDAELNKKGVCREVAVKNSNLGKAAGAQWSTLPFQSDRLLSSELQRLFFNYC